VGRCIGLDVHREFAEVAVVEHGVVRAAGQIKVTPEALRLFAESLEPDDEVAIEATVNTHAIARLLERHVARVVVSNPMKTRAIAEAKVKTDKVDAQVLAQLLAANFLPSCWLPDDDTHALRRQVARRAQIVRQRTRLKNGVHAILHRDLVPRCPAADVFGTKGRGWLSEQELPADERQAVEALLRQLDFAGGGRRPRCRSCSSSPARPRSPDAPVQPAPEAADIAWYLGAMAGHEVWRSVFDPATGRVMAPPPARKGHIIPSSHWPSFFSRIVARLQWDANGIDLAPDARAWPELAHERRERLTALLAGFRVAEDAVAEELAPFGEAANNSLVAWVMFLQRRDEHRHALLFDRIAEEVLGLDGATPAERRDAAREYAPPGVLELFEERLPTLAGELAAGRAGFAEGVGLYHMVLEGIVLAAGQRALLDDLEDGALPGVRKGVEHVELDERWHIGFGLRCLIEVQPSPDVIDGVLAQVEQAAAAWGDAVPDDVRDAIAPTCRRRLSVAKLLPRRVAA
jgi:hypothetical protein